ncbi:MAG: undecaprenyl-diphosphate phosphatase [Candidatus Hydrogenedentes bacterium]|nr:undecaprenyl-diphosphate phosphatase [Candidatus Hydrogenedentota bacterium]
MDYVNAVLLAVVEGVTEFLPISSTGHLILVEQWLTLGNDPEFTKTFLVAIQLPAILSVIVYFWGRLWPFQAGFKLDPGKVLLWSKVVAAFFPAAVLGFLFDDFIDAHLFNPFTVMVALIVGGVVILAIERQTHAEHIASMAQLSFRTAVLIGLFQCLAMIPGTSRSASSIIGALLLGASRTVAAEFSFFLAIPTMVGATGLKLLKNGIGFSAHQWALLAVGSVVSFVVAYAVIAFFMQFIRNRTFTIFGWYRIALGILILLLSFA